MNFSRDTISQTFIFIFGLVAIILVARKNKWGFVLGLAAEPFLFITSYLNHQRGIFFLSIAYGISRDYRIYESFFKDKKKSS